MARSAIVVGGGIGGLAAAIGLQRIGWIATVLEQAPEFGEVGAGMSQSPNALRALDELGVGQAARANSAPTVATSNLRLPSGRYLVQTGPDFDTPLVAFHRADLHHVLLEAVPAEWLRTGVEVTGLRQSADEATVTYTSDSGSGELTAELVVAADGIHSGIRQLLQPGAPAPQFRRYTTWLGIAEMDGLAGSVTLGRGQYFLIHPVGRGRVYWALGAHADRSELRHNDEHAEVQRRLDGWHDPIPALVDATPGDAVLHKDIADVEPLSSYAYGRVALLGDAAHAMTPDLGQGAGQSLEDAVVLAASLTETPDIPTALTRYDRERRPRTQSTARAARRQGRIMTSPSRLTHTLMTLAINLTPSTLWQRMSSPERNPTWNWNPPRLSPEHHDR